jgi:hypothetical protein
MRFFTFLLFFALGLFLYACGISPAPHYTELQTLEDQELKRLIGRVDGAFKNDATVREIEFLFQKAQKADILAIDSLLSNDQAGENMPYVNVAYRKIKNRQELLKLVLPLKSRKGYQPQFTLVSEVAEKEVQTRRAAADYLYKNASELVEEARQNGTTAPARQAHARLEELRRYFYPHWMQMDTLKATARDLGTVRVWIRNKEGAPVFNHHFSQEFFWVHFHETPLEEKRYDYMIDFEAVNIHVENESTSTSSHTETKQVQCGEEIERDTAGREIKRTPIYKTETVTTYSCTTERRASGWVKILLIDNQYQDTVLVNTVSKTYCSSESVNNSSSQNCPSAPSRWWMEDRVKGLLKTEIMHVVRNHLAL